MPGLAMEAEKLRVRIEELINVSCANGFKNRTMHSRLSMMNLKADVERTGTEIERCSPMIELDTEVSNLGKRLENFVGKERIFMYRYMLFCDEHTTS